MSDHLICISLIASQQGTKNFMSIEVAAQMFLFGPSDTGFSSTEIDGFLDAEGEPESQVPFSHNHLHDLESLWWVAVWVVFYNNFSKGTPSPDCPSLTRQDVESQLDLAETLFPATSRSTDRQNSFQLPNSFRDTCNQLPENKKAICRGLNVLRRLLISHYSVIEAKHPESVDPESSDDEIYDHFIHLFSNLKILSHNVKLEYIPYIYARLLKEEKNSKRTRSEPTTTVGRKNQRK
jgi:hypothetical protein